MARARKSSARASSKSMLLPPSTLLSFCTRAAIRTGLQEPYANSRPAVISLKIADFACVRSRSRSHSWESLHDNHGLDERRPGVRAHFSRAEAVEVTLELLRRRPAISREPGRTRAHESGEGIRVRGRARRGRATHEIEDLWFQILLVPFLLIVPVRRLVPAVFDERLDGTRGERLPRGLRFGGNRRIARTRDRERTAL